MALVYGDSDAAYFRRLEAERVALTGPTCEYYSLTRGAHVDAGYDEPTNDPLYGGAATRGTPQRSSEAWNYYPGPTDDRLQFQLAFEYQEMDNRTPSVRDEGFVVEYDAIAYVPRDLWECALEGTPIVGRLPKEGDVLYVFEQWWDVVRAGKGGYIADTPNYVGFKLELARRSPFVPERKVAV